LGNIGEFINESCIILTNKTSDLKVITDKICNQLMKIYDQKCINVIGRVKSNTSLSEKIIRKRYFAKYKGESSKLIENLSDLIGIRINCLLTKEETEIFEELKLNFMEKKEITYETGANQNEKTTVFHYNNEFSDFFVDLTSAQPEKQENGKSIYRIAAKWKIDDANFINIEIQIKSSINVLWGEIEHKLFYKNYEYLMSQEFYSEMMILLHENLDSVERQLELIKTHLEDSKDNVEDSKQILSKLLYKKFNDSCNKLANNCKLDFRHVYRLISEFYFTTPENAFKELQRAIDFMNDKLASFKYDEIESIKLNDTSLGRNSDTINEIVKIINQIIKEEDVFCIGLINICEVLFNEHEYTKLLTVVANKMTDKIRATLDELFDEIVLEDNKIILAFEKASIRFFSYYKKQDMFLKKNLDDVHKAMEKFIAINDEKSFQNINEDNIKLLEEHLIIILKLVNKREIDESDFNQIKLIYEKLDFNIVQEEYKNNFESLLENKNFETIINLLVNGKEVNDND